jgi:glutamine synthetase
MFANADEVLTFIREENVRFVDVRFCDLPGVMQHFNVPAEGGRGELQRPPAENFPRPRTSSGMVAKPSRWGQLRWQGIRSDGIGQEARGRPLAWCR